MGGEWHFLVVKDKDVNDAKPEELKLWKYQARLMDIRSELRDLKHSARMQNYTVEWFPNHIAAQTNIFGKFTYVCKRHEWHGIDETTSVPVSSEKLRGKRRKSVPIQSTASWTLYWNPLIVPENDVCSDVDALCAPHGMQKTSVEIQKQLATEFPKHFQLYLGDDIGGCGPATAQYWGVPPDFADENSDEETTCGISSCVV